MSQSITEAQPYMGTRDDNSIRSTHALRALWNFTVEPKSLDMLFFTVVFDVLFVGGFLLGAEWYNTHGDNSHTIPCMHLNGTGYLAAIYRTMQKI